MRDLRAALEARRMQGLYRSRRVVEGPQGVEVVVDGQQLLSFCSNDYLGLANHPEVVAALQRGAQGYGAGSGSAHLVSGHSRAHHALEEELAQFVQYPRALLFSTGYMANLGVVSALLQRGDLVLEDRLNHASLLDAGLLSGARLQRYHHADTRDLAGKLSSAEHKEKLVTSDGVFSMDGDLAPLPEMAALARAHDAWLMIDDAHGIGVLGEHGRGTLEHLGLEPGQVPILVGTLGKAFGTFGAFVAGSEELIETLIQQARPYIYTTALPPAVAEATRASLRLLRHDSWRREKLQRLIRQFRAGAQQLGLSLTNSETPIQPLIVGEAGAALQLSQALQREGIWISAIRPPTVPEGSARLRITLSAAHEERHVEQLLEGLDRVVSATGIGVSGQV